MSADPARQQTAKFPVVEGLVIQSRVLQSLQTIVREMEPELCQIHTSLKRVGEEGSHVWLLERLLGISVALRAVLASRCSDAEAKNRIDMQVDRLIELKKFCPPRRHVPFDEIVRMTPQHSDANKQATMSEQFRAELEKMDAVLLSFVMLLCFDT